MGRPVKKQLSKGLGDTIEKVIQATGLDNLVPDDCGCVERKEWLNRKFPYVMKEPETMNQEQRKALEDFLERNPKVLSPDDQDTIHSMYNSVFQVNTRPCTDCGSAEWQRMISKLTTVYEK